MIQSQAPINDTDGFILKSRKNMCDKIHNLNESPTQTAADRELSMMVWANHFRISCPIPCPIKVLSD